MRKVKPSKGYEKKLKMQLFAGNIATYYDVNENAGLTPELLLEVYPLIGQLMNMSYTNIVGDTVTFNGFDVSEVTQADVTGTPGGTMCDVPEIECGISFSNIVLHMNDMYDKFLMLDNCEVSKLESLGNLGATKLVQGAKAKVDKKYLQAQLKYMFTTDVIPKMTAIDVTNGTATSIWEEINGGINYMETQNPEVAESEYVVVMTKSMYRQNELQLKNKCCDFLTGKVPVENAFNEYTIVVVPDAFLKDGGTQYNIGIYIKKFFVYWFRCMVEKLLAGQNNYDGKTIYHKKLKYGHAYENFQTSEVSSLGVKWFSKYQPVLLGNPAAGAFRTNLNVTGEEKAPETEPKLEEKAPETSKEKAARLKAEAEANQA